MVILFYKNEVHIGLINYKIFASHIL